MKLSATNYWNGAKSFASLSNVKDVMKSRISSSPGKGDSSDCGPGDCGEVGERSPRKQRKQMAK